MAFTCHLIVDFGFANCRLFQFKIQRFSQLAYSSSTYRLYVLAKHPALFKKKN